MDLTNLIKKYKNSSFHDIYSFTLHSEHMKYVVDVNFDDLLNCINDYEEEAFSKDDYPLKKDLSIEKTTEYLKRFIKCFHNYSTSINALEKHYDNFFGRKCKSGLSTNNAEILFNEIKKDPLHLFIVGLRHYLIHEGIPSFRIALHKSKEKDDNDRTLYLTQGELKFKRSIILKDHRRAKPIKNKNGRSKSSFHKDDKKRIILSDYIRRECSGNYIDLKDIILNHYSIFFQHISSVEKEIINISPKEYKHTKNLHEKIKRRQSEL